jgi:pyruvate,water dikinase
VSYRHCHRPLNWPAIHPCPESPISEGQVRGTKGVKNVPVPAADRVRFAIGEDDILMLARWACLIEEHYSARRGQPTPMDMEWAKDGRTGELFIVQARPETVQALKGRNVLETYRLTEKGRRLATGQSVGEKIGQGRARLIREVQSLHEFRESEVLVTDKTDPERACAARS